MLATLRARSSSRPDPEAWAWDTGPRPNRAGVHGGPFVRQDSPLDLPRRYPGGPFERGLSPGWDRDAQFLASRGYTVVQIDPRGSAGRGPQRVRDGRGEADRGMLDDIGDGLSWLIEHGHIDDGPRCAVGSSAAHTESRHVIQIGGQGGEARAGQGSATLGNATRCWWSARSRNTRSTTVSAARS